MPIDLSAETPIRFNDAAKLLPGDRRPSYCSWWRWWRHGIRGVRLETVLILGRRYTSAEAVQRFIAAAAAVTDGERAPSRTAGKAQRDREHARRELAEARIIASPSVRSKARLSDR